MMNANSPHKQAKYRRWFLIGIVVFLFVGGFVMMRLTRAVSTSGQPLTAETDAYIVNTPATTDLSNSILNEIQILEQELQGDLGDETRDSLEAKLKVLYSEATQQAIRIQHLTTTPAIQNTFAPPTFEFYGQRETGIIQYPSVPFSSTEFKITNAWQELVNGQYVLIFAGTLARDPDQGVVIVTTESPRRTRQYLTPNKSGTITIAEAVGFRLIILSKTDQTYYFDVPGERFVSSLEEEVPTITPIPTGLPIATAPPYNPYP